ncbi:hypothetical protein E4U41_003049 [Claviceps citrina]|nr:hypothetical protein E4U41_003049 [Claviceps citrina]
MQPGLHPDGAQHSGQMAHESPTSSTPPKNTPTGTPPPHRALAHRPITATVGHRPRCPSSRQKKYAPKVRTGCLTCRNRRVKCDENKPACRRCSRSGLHCQGSLYQDSSAAATAGALAVRSPDRFAVLHEPAVSPAPVVVPAPSDLDMRMFHLMRTEAVQQMAGSFDYRFWALDVLRAAHVYPAIWHSCLAFAATYERLRIPVQAADSARARHECYMYALQHQNASIQEVVRLVGGTGRLSRLDKEALVLVNTLYAGRCSIDGELAESARHFVNALKFFSELQRSTAGDVPPAATLDTVAASSSSSSSSSSSPAPPAPPSPSPSPSSSSLSSSTSSLISQETYTKLHYTNRSSWGSMLPLRKQTRIHQDPPTQPFLTLQAAYLEFLVILSDLQDLSGYPSRYHGNMSPAMREAYRKTLFDWESRYLAFKFTSEFGAQEQERMSAMELWLAVAKLVADGTLDPCANVCSVPQVVLEDIIAAAEAVLELQAQKIRQHADFSFFIFSPSLHRLLFWVGHGYQDSQMRRMIVAIMRKWPRREPFWDTRHMAAILETIMLFEESGLQAQQADGTSVCGCVVGAPSCPQHRVARFGIRSMKEGESMLAIKTLTDCEEGLPGREIRIGW